MSIIYEALKKTQKHLERKTQPASSSISATPTSSTISPQGPTTSSPTKENKQILPVLLTIAAIGLIGCAVVFFVIALQNRTAPAPLSSQPETTPFPTDEPIPPTEASPAPVLAETTQPIKDSPQLILSGIIYTDSDQLALINNQIYRTGEYVEGKKIIRITPDKVELSDEGNIEILKTK